MARYLLTLAGLAAVFTWAISTTLPYMDMNTTLGLFVLLFALGYALGGSNG